VEDEPGRSATHLVAQRGGGPLRGVPDAGQHDPEDNQDLADENLGRGYAEIPPLLVPARCLPARVGRISTLSRQVKAHLRKMGTDRVINSCYGGAQLTRARSVRRRYTLTSAAADSGEPAQPRVGETRV